MIAFVVSIFIPFAWTALAAGLILTAVSGHGWGLGNGLESTTNG